MARTCFNIWLGDLEYLGTKLIFTYCKCYQKREGSVGTDLFRTGTESKGTGTKFKGTGRKIILFPFLSG